MYGECASIENDPYSQYGVPGDIGTINTYGVEDGHLFEEVIMYDRDFPNKQVFRQVSIVGIEIEYR